LVVHSADTVQGIITKWDVIAKVLATGRSTHVTTVGDVLSSPVRTIEAETSIEACSVRMADEKIRRFPVTRGGQIVGIISRKDILAAVGARHFRALRPRQGPTSLLVADVMGPSSGTADPGVGEALSLELSLWEAADRLRSAGLPWLPVVQAGKVIGAVTEGDILRGLEERGAGD
jgi:CBS domain-containing protein